MPTHASRCVFAKLEETEPEAGPFMPPLAGSLPPSLPSSRLCSSVNRVIRVIKCERAPPPPATRTRTTTNDACPSCAAAAAAAAFLSVFRSPRSPRPRSAQRTARPLPLLHTNPARSPAHSARHTPTQLAVSVRGPPIKR